jgi:hypothetical protein
VSFGHFTFAGAAFAERQDVPAAATAATAVTGTTASIIPAFITYRHQYHHRNVSREIKWERNYEIRRN